MGAVLAGDLISFFFFGRLWQSDQLWSFSVQVIKNRTRISIFDDPFIWRVILMVGIAGHCITLGSITFDVFELNSISSYLILFGFLINAAFPFSSWLPDSYPEASFSGSVFLQLLQQKRLFIHFYVVIQEQSY